VALPIVAIVGRPNVGKSTLFNRILRARLAVVHDEPGITRDRLMARAEWNGVPFEIIDTGGWVPEARERMDSAILAQVMRATEECDLVLFVTDARAGLHPHDEEIAQALFRQGGPVLLVVNKTDTERLEADAAEFRSLGFDDLFPISADAGLGIGELLDALVAGLPRKAPEQEAAGAVRVAVLGRPNVGKSSLVNRLLREERMIVDDVPGTTRDAVDSPLRYHGRTLVLVDTAGLRRKLDSQPAWEFYAAVRAMRALERANVAVLVLDATEPIHRQDARIADMIHDSGAAALVVVNKWDLIRKDTATTGEWITRIREAMPFLSHVPVEFVSALTTQRIHRIAEGITRVYDAARREVATSEWNEVLRRALEQNPPSAHKSQRPARIYYATQLKSAPPTVALFVSEPARVSTEYLRYLNGRFRAALGFEGSPIRIVLRKS
jgi:GTP-binding protein